MKDEVITSVRNPLVKRIKSISTKKGREENSMLLIEGTNLLLESLKSLIFPAEIILTSLWLEKNQNIVSSFPQGIKLHIVSEKVLRASLTTKTPDGVAAFIPLDFLPKTKQKPDFVLALDRLQDPGNMGTLFRTALAAEVDEVWLALGADPLSQKVVRASSGSIYHLPYQRITGFEEKVIGELVEKLIKASKRGFQIVSALVPSSISSQPILPYWDIDWTKPTVLLLGNEGSGIHPSIASCSTHFVTLPHSDCVESLNVAAVASPMLLERRRAKMTKEINSIK